MTSRKAVGGAARSRRMSLKLKPRLHIAEGRTLQAQLNKALGAGKAVVVDGSKVEQTDTASLQLLCAFFLSGRALGVDLRWKTPATALYRDAAMLGLADMLELPDAAPRATN